MSLSPVHFKYLTEEALKEWKGKEDGYRFNVGEGDEARFVYEVCWAVLQGDLSRAKVSAILVAASIGNDDKETVASLLADTIAHLGLEVPIGSSGEHRSRLTDLGRWLIDSQQVSSRLLKERCELDYLAEIEEVKDISLFKRKEIQINTRLHYTQTKFNLLREESEGYAKLLTLLSQQRPDVYTGKTCLPLINAVKSLIGYFDLDPNRVLDVVLNCYEHQPNNPPFLQIVNLFPKNNVPHILGFNFQFYQRLDVEENVPESLYLLAARVVKANCVNLESVYAHLLPKDTEAIAQYKESHNKRIEEVNKIGKINLAATGRDLMEDEKPGDITIDLYAALDAEERAINARKEELEKNQKFGLLKSFLDIDDWPHCVVLLEHLAPLDPVEHEPICTALCRMIDRAITPFYAMVKPTYLTRSTSTGASVGAVEAPAPMEIDGSKGKPAVEVPKEVFEMLTYLGAYLHRNVILLQKVCRLLRAHLVYAGAPASPPPAVGARGVPHQTTDAYPMALLTAFSLVDDVLSYCLLPSLQLLPANPAVGMEIWEVMKLLPFHWRYRLYGEWDKDGDKTPIVATARQVARMDTKKILRRLAKENLKPLGRMLAKIAHANPMTVLRTIVLQMEAYKDMIVPVVDAFKYLTQLEYDILEYVVIERLVQRGRDKLKEDGLNISDWLNSLASFWGHLCKKYPSMELRGLFQYLVNQLKRGEALELVMLQELITQMANIENVENLNDDQVEALAGGETVRQQTTTYIGTRNNKALAKSSARLRDALMPSSGVKLGVPLLLLIAQQRTRLIVSTDAPHVKMISELFDRCHGTLMQYVEFLLNAVTPATAYAQLLPSLDELVQMYHLEPEVAFLIYRPVLRLFKLKHGSMSAAWPLDMSKVALAMQGANADGVDEAAAAKSLGVPRKEDIVFELEENHPRTTWADVLTTVRGMLPARTWNSMSPELYITFWGLSLQDLYIPQKRYEVEIKKQEMMLKALEESADNSHVAIAKRKKEKERIQELLEKLNSEKQRQEQNVASVHQRLLREKDSWLSSCSDWSNTVTEFLQNCIFPRCVFSMMDAMYCAKFVHKIHSLGTPYFSTLKYVDHILCFDIQPLVCSCTEYEAGRLGKFLLETLRLLDHWKSTEEIYEKECHSLPGFATSFRDLNAKRAVYQDFVRVNFKWNHKLCRALVACLDSAEYIEIRNALTVLTKVVSVFPATRKIGSYIEKKVNKIKGEDREDLKVLATGVAAALASRKASWLTDEDFAGGVRLPSFSKAMSPSQSNAAGTPNANANKAVAGTGGGVPASGTVKGVAKPNTSSTPQISAAANSATVQKSPTPPPSASKSPAGVAASTAKQETPAVNAGAKPGPTVGGNAGVKPAAGDSKDKAQQQGTTGAPQGATAGAEASARGGVRGNGVEEGTKSGLVSGKGPAPIKPATGDGGDAGRPGSGRGSGTVTGNKQGTQAVTQQASSAPVNTGKQGVQSQVGGATSKVITPKEAVPPAGRGGPANASPALKVSQGTRTMNGSAQGGGVSGNVGTPRAANTSAGPTGRGPGDGKGNNELAKGGGRTGMLADTASAAVTERPQVGAAARDRSTSEREADTAGNVQKMDGGRQKGAGVVGVGRSPIGKGGGTDREDVGVEPDDTAGRERGSKRLPTDDGDRGSKRRKGMGDDMLERDAGGERDRRERSTDHGSAGGSVDGRHEDGRSRERSLDREKEDDEDEGAAKDRKRRKSPRGT